MKLKTKHFLLIGVSIAIITYTLSLSKSKEISNSLIQIDLKKQTNIELKKGYYQVNSINNNEEAMAMFDTLSSKYPTLIIDTIGKQYGLIRAVAFQSKTINNIEYHLLGSIEIKNNGIISIKNNTKSIDKLVLQNQKHIGLELYIPYAIGLIISLLIIISSAIIIIVQKVKNVR